MKIEKPTYQFIQSLWQVAVESLLIVDTKGVIQDCNPMASAMLSLAPGLKLTDHIREKEQLQNSLQNAVLDKKSHAIQPLHLISHANHQIVHIHLSPILEPDKSVQYLLISINPKTQALESLEAVARRNDQRVEKLRENLTTVTKELLEKTLQLADQKNKVATIINGMGEGLIGCDEQGSILHFNQAACTLLVPPHEEILGTSFTTTFPEVTRAIGYRSDAIDTLEKKFVDISINRKDLRISVSPILVEEKQRIAGFVLIIQDRSEQAELDRMKSDLISIVSHELRSPLTSIKGYVDLMISGDLGEITSPLKDYLTIISSNANRLAALIDDMLDLSRIETGKLNMTFGKVEIKYLCDYVFLTMKPQAEQKKLRFTLDIEEGLSISGDQERLQQALTNLVSNAIKYTPNDGSVTLRAKRHNGEIAIDVIDTGLGISPDNQKKLFQRFFRVKNDKTRNIGGTGLGLCITKSIIEAHDGQITIDSDEGKGSRFTLELPAYHS